MVFNVARVYPFKRKEAVGKQRWYEKISFTYTGKLTNSANAAESEIFTKQTLKNMKNGVEHSIPVSSSFTLFKYINFTPSFNYTERWYFKRQMQQWNPAINKVEKLDPEYGFWRIYNYNASVSANTTIYGTYTAKKKERKLQETIVGLRNKYGKNTVLKVYAKQRLTELTQCVLPLMDLHIGMSLFRHRH